MVMPSLAGYEDEKPFDSAWEEVSLYAGSTPAICTIFLFGGEAGWQIEDSQSGLKVQNK